jgi:hypothetical protein
VDSFNRVVTNWISEVTKLAAAEVSQLLSDAISTPSEELARLAHNVKGVEKDLGAITIRVWITIEKSQVYGMVTIRSDIQTIRDGVNIPLSGDPMVLISDIKGKAEALIGYLKKSPDGYRI